MSTNQPSSSSPLPLSLLPKCHSTKEIQQIHATAIKTNLQFHLPTMTQLIKACAIHSTPSSMAYAEKMFDEMPHRDTTVLNAVVRGYASTPVPLRAFAVFAGVAIPPDTYTVSSLAKACAAAKATAEGKQTHGVAVKNGFYANEFVVPTLINMYAECGNLSAARGIFDGSDNNRRCVFAYNAMITACTRGSRPGEAMALFREMLEGGKGVVPTDVTMLSVLSACALLGSLELGKWVNKYVEKNGFTVYVKVKTALIDMYAKCGSLEDAFGVFQTMGSSKDTQAFSAMIVGCGIHGRGDLAVSLFEQMKIEGIAPDGVTFLGLLHACSHAGLVNLGLRYFQSMRSDYGVSPGIKHYGCVVDLLARSGRLHDAFDFIDRLPVRPTAVLWRTLLSACGGPHANVDLGKRVFDRIRHLDDSHGGDYVIFSNMCAAASRWEDVDRIRRLMKERGAAKVPGCSSIEVGGMVHEFFASDGQHPQSEAVRRAVDELIEQLKLVGYVPDVSQVHHQDMGEEEKEASLRYHSEKLAVGFGLMNTPPGTVIRVVKNLRICGDCHSMAKYTSLLFGRKIVVRDLNRFHHFLNGECSCNDYW